MLYPKTEANIKDLDQNSRYEFYVVMFDGATEGSRITSVKITPGKSGMQLFRVSDLRIEVASEIRAS